jgi:hypothetical protein
METNKPNVSNIIKNDKNEIKTVHLFIILILMLGVLIEVFIYLRNNTFLKAIVANNNPYCYTDWKCNTTEGHVDNTLPSKYAAIAAAKNLFVTTPITTPVAGANILSSPPSAQCKDTATNDSNQYKSLPTTGNLEFQGKPLSSSSAETAGNLPKTTFFCKPTDTTPPTASAEANI